DVGPIRRHKGIELRIVLRISAGLKDWCNPPLCRLGVLREPKQVIVDRVRRSSRALFLNDDAQNEVRSAEHLIQHCTDKVNVLIAYLYEDAATIGQQVSCSDEPVPQIREVRMHSESPSVTVRADHFRLARQVCFLVLDLT